MGFNIAGKCSAKSFPKEWLGFVSSSIIRWFNIIPCTQQTQIIREIYVFINAVKVYTYMQRRYHLA